MNLAQTIIARLRHRMRSPLAEVPAELAGSVEDFVGRRARELDRWFVAIRMMIALTVAGFVSVDVVQSGGGLVAVVLLGAYLAANIAIWIPARRIGSVGRWAFAALDLAAVVILRQAFSFELLVDPNATMVAFFTLCLLAYTVYGDPRLNRALAIGTWVVTSATMGADLLGSGTIQTGVLAYQRYPLRMLIILVYLGAFCLVTYGLAARLREYVLDYSVELHRRIEAAMTSTAERGRREKLEELNRLKRDFISILSHELRTPLTPLRSSLEMIRAQNGSRPDDAELLGIALESTDKLQRLVQDYTQLAELLTSEGAGMMRWNLRLSTLIDELRSQGGLRRVDSVDLDGLIVAAEPKLLGGALLALVRRATLISSAHARISLRGYATGREVVLEIHDPESYLERDVSEMLDDPFAASSERTFVSASTGLELILARHSLHRIGGKLRFTSAPSEGTTIICTLPAMQHGAHWLSDAQLRFELEPLRLHAAA